MSALLLLILGTLGGWAIGRMGAIEEAAILADECHAPDIACAIRQLGRR